MNTEPPAWENEPLIIPDGNCPHENFQAFVGVPRIMDRDYPNAKPKHFKAEIIIKCVQCGGNFMFKGLPRVISCDEVGTGASGCQASLPIIPWDGTLAGKITVKMP